MSSIGIFCVDKPADGFNDVFPFITTGYVVLTSGAVSPIETRPVPAAVIAVLLLPVVDVNSKLLGDLKLSPQKSREYVLLKR